MLNADEMLAVCVRRALDVLCGLQNVAHLGSGLQSAQQRQLTIIERLDAVALDCISVNSSVLSYDDVITSLSARLASLQAVVNDTLVSSCFTDTDTNLHLCQSL